MSIEEKEEFRPKIVAFCCNWCSYAGADLAGSSRLTYPADVKIIRVPCSCRVNPMFILRAFEKGADGVIMCGCHPGDCHYSTGNYYARRRMTLLFSMLDYIGVESGRTRVEWVSAAEGVKFSQTMNEFAEKIYSLGRNVRLEDIVYGSRSANDLVQLKEIREVWMKSGGVNVYLTIDREQEDWNGHVGFVPDYVKELGFDTDKTALVCGPPIMIKFVLAGLKELGFTSEQVYTTLELRMKCGVGKCGRCNIGSKYVCKDGPVFRYDEIDELPNEY